MAKKRKTLTKQERSKILAEVAEKGVAAVAAAHGIPPATIYGWKTAAKKRRAKKKRRGAEPAAAKAPAAANGSANGSLHASGGGPTIELKGLRAWIDAAVEDSLRRRFGGAPTRERG